uniref:Cytochrome b n=1 Tax=Pteria penguin TaxID=113549 RepID=A0A1P8CZ16_PTEPN|nr:cytochrome b [Pteria penguin]
MVDCKFEGGGGPEDVGLLALKGVVRQAFGLPCPRTLNVWWNFGSCLMLLLVSQLVTGLFLAVYYVPECDKAMSSVYYVMRDIRGGWVVRLLHASGANVMFACIYFHIGRGLYYGSYLNKGVWWSGMMLLVLSMGVAFMGYVLPWGSMSYWGAVVITSMVTILPYGSRLKEWIWGGYVISEVTLKRFFIVHFVLPFVLLSVTLAHVMILHKSGGSSNPLGLQWEHSAIPFHPYYTSKDVVGFIVVYGGMLMQIMWAPDFFMEGLNYLVIDPMKTPLSIKPEWYFLFLYCILRSIPHKSGGIIAMFGALLILAMVPYLHVGKYRSMAYYPLCQIIFWVWVGNLLVMTKSGSLFPTAVNETVGLGCTVVYFAFFLLLPVCQLGHEKAVSFKIADVKLMG